MRRTTRDDDESDDDDSSDDDDDKSGGEDDDESDDDDDDESDDEESEDDVKSDDEESEGRRKSDDEDDDEESEDESGDADDDSSDEDDDRPTEAASADGHDDGTHGHGHDEISHVLPLPLLIGVLVALMALTGLTVVVADMHLGSKLGLAVAMVIATVKAGLVMMYFMHLRWDKKFNVLVFLGSFLFVILFLSMAITDRGEYQPDIDNWTQAQ